MPHGNTAPSSLNRHNEIVIPKWKRVGPQQGIERQHHQQRFAEQLHRVNGGGCRCRGVATAAGAYSVMGFFMAIPAFCSHKISPDIVRIAQPAPASLAIGDFCRACPRYPRSVGPIRER
ncbi:uncharacterized protein PSANT_02787 [Moesziomyces antarcticus]|uniref:Uncharacterized protein n=1 Tax=Pseudozyma antarctica TaxID=84753 RepID=A0A5C3FNN2_PSEA2|nr:uncharacterized protein PSANT_02787 [Moesziomyces antarcticus]